MNKQFEKLAKEINFETTPAFEFVNIKKAQLIDERIFELEFEIREILPFEEMIDFLTHLNSNFKYKTKFKFDVETIYWKEDVFLKYFNWVLKSFLGKATIAKQVSYCDISLEENDFHIIVIDPYLHSTLSELKPTLERILGKLGWKNIKMNITFEKMDESFIEENLMKDKLKAKEVLEQKSEVKFEVKQDRTKMKKVPIKELESSQLTRVYIEGEIFNVDHFQTKGDYQISTFSITDYEDAIYVKAFANNDDKKKANKAFVKGDYVTIQGTYQIDAYSNQPTINANKITKTKSKIKIRKDESKFKRVELSTRSRMSTMDGLIEPKKLIETLEKWGHESVAINDLDNVQGFPEFYNSTIKSKIKPIYGATFSVINENPLIVRNPSNANLVDETYIVFDLETTGLSPEHNEIIEFGAIKIKDNQVIDKIQFFIKPKNPISKIITSITGITDDDVSNGLNIKEGLSKIKEFISDHTLVAHNATFDFSFLNAKFNEKSEPELKNTVIDTLVVARLLEPKKRKFNLESVSSRFGIDYDSTVAHRADYDAEVLLKIWMKMINFLIEKNILTIKQLQEQRDDVLYEKQFAKEISVLAKNQSGLKDLFKLVSKSSTERYYKGNKLFISDFNDRKNLFIGTGGMNSRLFEKMMYGTKMDVIKEIEFYDYVEIPPISHFVHLVNREQFTEEQLKKSYKFVVDEALKQNKIVIASCEARYIEPKEKIYHEVYISSKGLGGKPHSLFSYRDTNTIYPSLHFMTTEEIMKENDYLKDIISLDKLVVDNTVKIASKIEKIEVIKNDLYTPKMKNADKMLKNLVYKNAREQYGNELPEYLENRIEKELQPIIKYGFDVIYWIAHLLVKKSLDDGYLVGSRGSVGSSIVATFAQISEVNPLAPHYVCSKCQFSEFFEDSKLNSGYDLPDKECPKCKNILNKEGQKIPFETFLGFDANKVPDIDLNFSGDYQPIIHAEVKKLFGESHSFRAGTISTVAERTAYGYVAGWMETKGMENSKAFKEFLAQGVAGTKRTTGQHPGGIIVIPKEYEVEDFTPINFPANDITSNWKTTHFDFHAIHDNVLKLDLLGHDDPTAIKQLERLTGKDPKTIPMYDEKVLSIFSSTEALGITPEDIAGEKTGAMGIPEFGTKFVRGMLSKASVKSFGDLIAISGLSHGTDVWSGNAETLIKTMGLSLSDIVSCRDDIMSDLIRYGVDNLKSFKIMENVRKGKGLTESEIILLKEHNVEDWYIDTLQKIKYMFPKAHATAYVMMAWRIAWFKVYYPLQYYATYFTTRADFADVETFIKGKRAIVDKLTFLDKRKFAKGANSLTNKEQSLIPILEISLEANARGIKFMNFDMNKSSAKEWLIDEENNSIIPPLSALDGLGDAVAESVMKAREDAPFTSVKDLVKRTSLNKTHIKKFKEQGVLDGWNDSDQISMDI